MADELREAVARALAKHDRIEICSDASYALSSYGPKADAALSLMQPEIARRVAEERAKLLEGLADYLEGYAGGHHMAQSCAQVVRTWPELLAQFEKENSHEQG